MINFSIRRLVHEKNLYMEVQYSTVQHSTALQHPGFGACKKMGCNII